MRQMNYNNNNNNNSPPSPLLLLPFSPSSSSSDPVQKAQPTDAQHRSVFLPVRKSLCLKTPMSNFASTNLKIISILPLKRSPNHPSHAYYISLVPDPGGGCRLLFVIPLHAARNAIAAASLPKQRRRALAKCPYPVPS